ncbi:MAG: PDZ domain-containing protein, partial [Comamonas sp.]|nr:PDZ domain-containing protein [Comamonas sp.]
AQRKSMHLKGGVQLVSADEAAARAGLKQGDVILGIANTESNDVKQFDAAVAKADKSKPVNVLFRRGEWTQYVLIRPTK